MSVLPSLVKMDMGTAFSVMVDKLSRIEQAVRDLQSQRPPERPEDRVDKIRLSSAGNRQRVQVPTAISITGIFLTSETTGRNTLNFGQDPFPIYSQAFATLYYKLDELNRIDVENTDISFTPANANDVWDIVLFWHPKRGQMQGAPTRS